MNQEERLKDSTVVDRHRKNNSTPQTGTRRIREHWS